MDKLWQKACSLVKDFKKEEETNSEECSSEDKA